MTPIADPRAEGRRAAIRGADFTANPYPLGSNASREWSKGYRSMEDARG